MVSLINKLGDIDLGKDDKEQNFQQFMRCLMKAIESIDVHYFQLPIAGTDKPIYRERVYCYELYHQLRCVLGDNFHFHYELHGEVDKAGHPIIRNAKKPDFIVHKPGNMSNLVVIELKPVTVGKRVPKLKDDFNTLKWFINKANYYRGIMLIYGNVNGNLPLNIQQEIKDVNDGRIIIIWHYEPNKEPKIIEDESYIA